MTKIDKEFLALQLDYSRWASERTLQAARSLTHEELTRDLGDSYQGVLGTLAHIFQADRIWLSRLRGSPRFTLSDPSEIWTLDGLAEAWPLTADGYRDWLYGVKDLQTILPYRNLAGQSHALPVWQVVLHVVNHATYHRGQVTTMLRQLGYPAVATDLHVFYLSRQNTL
ncbi:MAG TPA: DinB family protein [Bryobacteraceae bacterium]|nr:DinB family protein [Bryobacteraceae bacterium]